MKGDKTMERDNRELEGRTCLFDTKGTDSELTAYDKQFCLVLNRIDEQTYDFEDVGTMWRVELLNGKKTDAFADELELV